MAININTVTDYFEYNGNEMARIYQPLVQGINEVGIYNIYDTKQMLVSGRYDEFVIDGISYSSQTATISALLPVIYNEPVGVTTINESDVINWDVAYDDSITNIGVTGTATKTITLTQRDGSTLTANFADNSGGSGGGDSFTGATFNTGTGNLDIISTGTTISVNLDGRYLETITDDYVNSASFNTGNGVLTLNRISGGTATVDLDGRYLTSFTETYSTPSQLLTAIKTVDGSGSGLDADLLDGQNGTYYQTASNALTTSTNFGGDVSGTYNAIVIANDSHTHDGRYYTETESDAKYLLNTTDTLTGNLTVTGTITANSTLGAGTASELGVINLKKGDGGEVAISYENNYMRYRRAGAGIVSGWRWDNYDTVALTLTTAGALTAVGDITAPAFYEASDITLKTNIKPISKTFRTFELKEELGIKRYGVIAQEVEANNPELVKTNEAGIKSVNYIDLLVMKLAEQENRIEELENIINEINK